MGALNARHSRGRRLLRAATGGVALVGACAVAGPAIAAPPMGWTKTVVAVGARSDSLVGEHVTLSADGSTLVVDNDKVFVSSRGRWVRTASLPPFRIYDPHPDFSPRGPIAISGDGRTVVIRYEFDEAGDIGGPVMMFVRRRDRWVRQAWISNPHAGDSSTVAGTFGGRLALSADGNTALVGCGSGATPTGEGEDYFYVRTGGSWRLAQHVIVALNPSNLGGGVLSGDGTTALLNWGADQNGERFATFGRSGDAWVQQGPLASAAYPTGISADGQTAIAALLGGLQILVRSGSTWTIAQTVGVSGTIPFGVSAALSGNGASLVVGSKGQLAGRGTGLVYSRTNGAWTKTATLPAPGPEAAPALSGVAVAISANGRTAVLGEPGADHNRGIVAVYRLHVLLTRPQWAWLRRVYVPAHYAPARRAVIWTALTADPDAALRIIDRYGPSRLH
jgi:hypothetical protein